MKKLAIIGASYLQEPLIQKAKSMGLETHVFAWAVGDVGEKSADFFYPISIVEKEEILNKCREIGIDGICSIASDLAAITVNYVAENMKLVGNTMEATTYSTNKHSMRLRFEENGDPSPKSVLVYPETDLTTLKLSYPVIVKPTDRSGSRGITKLECPLGLIDAVRVAEDQGFEKAALIEEFAIGQEYSVECISWRGIHHFLAMTEKYTTGSPHFIENGHIEPARVTPQVLEKVKNVVFHALDSLKIRNSASHSEIKINDRGEIKIIEIGGRMGGDFIGSSLVEISTGIDFVRAIIQVALGEEPDLRPDTVTNAAGIRFIFEQSDIDVLKRLKQEHPEFLVEEHVDPIEGHGVSDSSNRFGYFIMKAQKREYIEPYMPKNRGI